MQEETVVFKLDVSDIQIKRKAMKAVWKFSGVTLVDINEKGKLKVRGTFGKFEMGLKLKKIDNSVDIIDSMGSAEQNYNHGISSSSNRGNVPKMQIILEVFDVRKANTVIWEFPGVTSVEVKGVDQLVVKGEFNNLEMVKKLKKKDKDVNVLKVEEYVEEPPHVGNMSGTNQFDAGSSNGPKAPERSNSMPAAQPQVNQPPQRLGGWNNPQPQNKEQEQGGVLAYLGLDNPQLQFKKLGQVGGGLIGFLGRNKQQPKIEPPRQDFEAIQKEKAEKRRIEKENAEKKQKIDQANAEKKYKEELKAHCVRIGKEDAENKKRAEKAQAEKQRIQKEEAAKAERRRIEKEQAAKAEKQRIEKEQAAKAERRRIEREAERRRNSTSQTGGQETPSSWEWLTSLGDTTKQLSSQITGAIGSTISNSTSNFSTSNGASGSRPPNSTTYPFTSQSTRTSRYPQYQSSTKKP